MKARILERIEREGPLRFDHYMEMALYDPEEGFFASGRVRPGLKGDFVTSPEVSPWFGRLIGRWAASVATDGSRLVEIGAGSGALLEPLLEEAGGCFTEVYATERSFSARSILEARLGGVTVAGGTEAIPPGGHAVVVMNEVLDNVPFRLVQRESASWLETVVTARNSHLTFGLVPADERLRVWCDSRLGPVSPGVTLAVQQRAHQLVADLLSHFERCDLLIVDYAATATDIDDSRRPGVVRGYADQQRRDEILDAPGSSDITTDVDVRALDRSLGTTGATLMTVTQRDLLVSHGASDVIDDLVEASHTAARSGDTMTQLMRRSEATGLRALIDPDGFGGFAAIRVSSGTG